MVPSSPALSWTHTYHLDTRMQGSRGIGATGCLENTDHENQDPRPQTPDLENPDLKNADLENTDLENANFENTDLLKTTNVSKIL